MMDFLLCLPESAQNTTLVFNCLYKDYDKDYIDF